MQVPLNLKRSPFSHVHYDADLDRLLEAPEQAMVVVLSRHG